MREDFTGKRVLITGGTGSLGVVLLRKLLEGSHGVPSKIRIFSRDEAKQYALRAEYQLTGHEYKELFNRIVEFRVGDIRDYSSIAAALRDIDVVFNTAALKQVPTCEYAPFEAVRTNIAGPENIIRAIEQQANLHVETVIGISTDKACKPVNVMGMTKAIQERLFLQGNLRCPQTRFIAARYGNVLASRGSVIPLFLNQIRNGGPVTVTTSDMTRFLLSLDAAAETIFEAERVGLAGETYIPICPAAKIMDVAKALICGLPGIEVKCTGIRPGEKIHEILVSEEEVPRAFRRGNYYVIGSGLPELSTLQDFHTLSAEYSSKDGVLSLRAVASLLRENGFPA